MSFCSPNSLLHAIPHPPWPLLLYAVAWTTVLTVTVALVSFSPELAFVSAISSSSSFSQACGEAGSVRLPLDNPSEHFCFPSQVFKRSRIDVIVPPVFAAVIVSGSAFLVKALGLWESDEDDEF
ncbi:uncharacterized protein LOC127252274 [Andrographis paniculata]|uniref:uncharacterized protein LOC127252274 n=1 Tax=Andrographis paniculata TaxID=175694 RepID=UPI0021E8FBB4|nr:uncharacterized protein LOC127252274 [Andrographis paniculata]